MKGNGEKTAVILDRYPLWLEALEHLLERVGVTVIGKTTSASGSFEMIGRMHPSIFIAEYDAIEQSEEGLAALRRVTAKNGGMHSIVLSEHDHPAHVEAAFAAGVSVYCVKTAEPDDLASAIRQAFDNSIYYAGARDPLSAEFANQPVRDDFPRLTQREIEILQLTAEGHSNSQIASMLWVTEQTVKFHLSNIYRKLDVANRTEASRWAQIHGLLPAAADSSTEAA